MAQALSELRKKAGSQFDAGIVEHFCRYIAEKTPSK